MELADGSSATMSRGFHAFFRQYYNLRGLLRRVDPGLEKLRPLPDYPLLHGSGLYDSFARVPRTPPWSAVGFAALSPSFGVRDLARMNPRAALPLLDVRLPGVHERYDDVSARELLDRIRFPEKARHLAFEVFSRSFFADPGELSAAELALMFHIYFLGSSEGLLFDVPDEPYPQALWEPLARYLEGHGVDVRTGAPVDRVETAPGGGHLVHGPSGTERVDALVLALDTAGLRAVAAASPTLCDEAWRTRVAALRTAPPFLVTRLWLDRPVAPDRPGFLGTGGYGPLDNISVLDRWRARPPAGPGRPAAPWSSSTPTRRTRRRARPRWGGSWSSSSTACTRRRRARGSSTGATSGGRTARSSPSAATRTGPPSRPRTPPSPSPATWSAPTCRWR